jgi:hypothetical protein
MKKPFSILLAILAFISCNTQKNYPPATDALDAAREFLGSCLAGNFEKASFYMVQDAKNIQLLKEAEQTYRAKTTNQRKQFGETSLQNITIEELSTSSTIINYAYSFDKVGRKVKAVMVNNAWLIDFKYTFNPNL